MDAVTVRDVEAGEDGRTARARAWWRFDRQLAAVTVLPLLLLTLAHAQGGLPIWLVALTLLLGVPHVFATAGLYADADVWAMVRRRPTRFLWAPLAMVPVFTVAFVLAHGRWLALLVTVTFLWQTQHYTKQNVGAFGMWARARGDAPVSTVERDLIMATTAIGMLGILRMMELVPEWDGVLRAAGVGVLVVTAGAAIVVGRDRARTLALLTAVAFYAPLHLFHVDLLAAAFAYQAAHGAQYELIVAHSIRRDRRAQRVTVAALAVGCVGVLLLREPILLAAPALFGMAKGIGAAHFLADARLWRLRDPEIRTILSDRFDFL